MQSIYKKYISIFGSQLQSLTRLLLCHSLVPQQLYSKKTRGQSLYIYRVLLAGLALPVVYLTGCEKVIDVDLNAAEKKYVIEAVITDQPNSCKVSVTQTKDFDEDNQFDGVRFAQVTISDNNGSAITLNETTPGVYEANNNFLGQSGHTYALSVKIAGQSFTATSTMPSLVPFDSLYISERALFGETNKYATLLFKDPEGKGNAYRYIQYVNGVKEKTVFVRDDDLNDGRPIERVLFFFNDDDDENEKKLKTGDNVRVEMLGIDYPVFKYWYSLSQSSTGENQSATPGNPATNIKGGALGYFSAHTLQSKTVVVP